MISFKITCVSFICIYDKHNLRHVPYCTFLIANETFFPILNRRRREYCVNRTKPTPLSFIHIM